jgi:hypothetical protein
MNGKLGRDGITGNKDTDAEVERGNHEPNPDKDQSAVHAAPIVSLVDLSRNKNEYRQQNQSDQRQPKCVHGILYSRSAITNRGYLSAELAGNLKLGLNYRH